MTNGALLRICALTLTCAVIASAGCTTDISKAVRLHDSGNHALAAEEIERITPTVAVGNKATPDVSYEKDRLWVTVEKATILFQAKRFAEAVELMYHAWNDADDDRYMESWYADNPLDPGTWDAKKLAEDFGQLVAGADQTSYVMQPYEMILCCAYSALGSILSGQDGFMQYSRRAVRLQVWEGEDLARAGYVPPVPTRSSLNGAVSLSMPQGQTSNFDTNMVFSLGDFRGTQQRLNAAISSAADAGAADPRVAFAAVVAWASFVKGGEWYEASGVADYLTKISSTPRLVKLMRFVGQADVSRDFVLVLVDSGRAPERTFFNVAFPIIIPGVGSAYFRAVYPSLKFRQDDRPTLVQVENAGRLTDLELLNSIDAIAARNFLRREAELWWIPTLRAALRTVAAIVAQAADRNREGWGVAVLATSVVLSVAEQADLRAWSTLPATQHAILIPRPESGNISIVLSSSRTAGRLDVSVPDGSSVVYVRALTPSVVHAHTGVLRPAVARPLAAPLEPATDEGGAR